MVALAPPPTIERVGLIPVERVPFHILDEEKLGDFAAYGIDIRHALRDQDAIKFRIGKRILGEALRRHDGDADVASLILVNEQRPDHAVVDSFIIHPDYPNATIFEHHEVETVRTDDGTLEVPGQPRPYEDAMGAAINFVMPHVVSIDTVQHTDAQ
jgi:hypothetical protein